ncbi:HAMP domain-containing histidine kinase [Paenibacillus doosanensis]|uniref:sensor histidine kinase n=1 Tax=Paenibacillus doosanensis TaxID=1229154 RepID=UPI00217F7C60|nr:HAMP domain-containing sensor histidine kinase [Paenibacillus doosanensis]MCS7461272.1 HAMP domain-containing histidine kinase [Paenibacillus doosanensis]
MRLRTKITLLIASSIVIVLFLFNIVTYYMVVRITTRSEITLLWNAAQTLASQPNFFHKELWGEESWLRPLLVPQEMIRFIDTNSNIVVQLDSSGQLADLPVQFDTRSISKTLWTKNALIAYIQMPIMGPEETLLGALQISRKLDTLNEYLTVLITVLMFTTAGAALLSIVGGMYFARVILQPIHELGQIMESIQKNGIFKRVVLPPSRHRDELGRLTHTFNAMIGKLENSFLRQQQFLADASHELKTPLTVIESYADLLQRWGGKDAALREEAIEAIRSEAGRLRNLTHSLLVIANMEADPHRPMIDFELADLVRTTAASLQRTFRREIRFSNELQFHTMHGNPEKVKQLVIILLDNAIKYSQKPVEITLKHDPRDPYIVELQVTDRGIGIEEAEIPRLFDRFYRVDQARSRSTGGSGLGLAIARKIVQSHQGTISIASRPGQGTRVTVRLPLHAAAHALPSEQDHDG